MSGEPGSFLGGFRRSGPVQKIAQSLKSFVDCFPVPGQTAAFHPHGDEFYYIGECNDTAADDIVATLKLAAEAIGQLRVLTQAGEMRCTVSTGWVFATDLLTDQVLTEGLVKRALECAVQEAKWTQEIVRYSSSLEEDPAMMLRSQCATCRCKFSVNLKRSAYSAQDWSCPICHSKINAPPMPTVPDVPRPAKV